MFEERVKEDIQNITEMMDKIRAEGRSNLKDLTTEEKSAIGKDFFEKFKKAKGENV